MYPVDSSLLHLPLSCILRVQLTSHPLCTTRDFPITVLFCSNQGITKSELSLSLSLWDGRYIVRVAAFHWVGAAFCIAWALKTSGFPMPGHHECVCLGFDMLSVLFVAISSRLQTVAEREETASLRLEVRSLERARQVKHRRPFQFWNHCRNTHPCATRPDGLAALTHPPSHAGHAAHATHSAHASET